MKGIATTPKIPFGLQAELRRVRETQRALGGGLAGQMLREQGLEPRASLTAPGALDPSLGAFGAFQADHEKTLESIRSLVRGAGFSDASEPIAGTSAFADIPTGVGKDLRDTLASTKRVGYGGLSETVEETARIAMRSVGTESRAFGMDPDFIRDASSIAFGRPGRTHNLLGDDPFGFLGISGKRWGEQLETLTRGLAPMFSVAGLRGAPAGQTEFNRTSREALAAIRGVTPGLRAADRFDYSGFLSGHRRGAEGISSLVSGAIVDQAQIEKLSRTALSLSGALTPDLSEVTRGIFESPSGPWARGGVLGDASVASALELNSVFGPDAAGKLRSLDLAGLGTLGLDRSLARDVLEPTTTRRLIRDLGADFDFARSVIDSPAWVGRRGFASDPGWSELLANAEAALNLSAADGADEPAGEDRAAGRETMSVADRMREMGFWFPAPKMRDAAFWINFLVALDTVSEAMASGDPRKVLFAMMTLAALTMTWRGGPRDGD
jgi:hypothetical protein